MSLPEIPAPPASLDDPALYINREKSWLEFNRRVLSEGADPSVPLMERLKFLAIYSSNLDEFFMVRVGGLQRKVQAGITRSSGADKLTPQLQLDQTGKTVRQCVALQYEIMSKELLPALEAEGVRILAIKDIGEGDRKFIQDHFRKEVFPVLTPLAIDPVHPFPHLLNKSLNLAVVLQSPRGAERKIAVVQVPAVLSRFIPLPAEKGNLLVPLETVIRLHLGDLFPGMKIEQAVVFRLTRDSEYEIDDEEVEDLMKAIEEEVRKRRRGNAVRLEIEQDTSPELELFLATALNLEEEDVYRVPGLIDLSCLFQIHALPGYEALRDPQHVPQTVFDFTRASSPFAAIRTRDILVHHPYESFSHTVDFIEAAASDSRVLAIKQTLYRTSSDSPIVRALQRAADSGKQVTAVVELKARMDEERNILWAREMEKSGVHVVFGFIGLKTHCKTALVVRKEEDGIRRYVHLSTGNYNPQTARFYTDIGYFTCRPDFAEDVSALFNYLTGYSELPQWRKLIVAPSRLQDFMIEKIDAEAAFQKAGKKGRIRVKINGLLEPAVIKALYRASQAGVKVEIACRGICALRPGVPGVSENIRVISIIDHFLEHSRIFYFGNGGEPEVYIGSADWMDRNLSRRVEVVFPIEEPDLKKRVIEEILATTMADSAKARELQYDGSYTRVVPKPEEKPLRSQLRFVELANLNAQRVIGPETSVTKPIPARRARKRK